jgi:hypothetical protein
MDACSCLVQQRFAKIGITTENEVKTCRNAKKITIALRTLFPAGYKFFHKKTASDEGGKIS